MLNLKGLMKGIFAKEKNKDKVAKNRSKGISDPDDFGAAHIPRVNQSPVNRLFDQTYKQSFTDFNKDWQSLIDNVPIVSEDALIQQLNRIRDNYPKEVSARLLKDLNQHAARNGKLGLALHCQDCIINSPHVEGVFKQRPMTHAELGTIITFETKRASHTMGLDSNMGFKDSSLDETREVRGRGVSTEHSLEFLNEKLAEYKPPENEAGVWTAIKDTFVRAERELSVELDDRAELDRQRILENPPQLVHLGQSWWTGAHAHAIGVTFFGDYMIVCNRGNGGPLNNCTHVYPFDRSKITAEQLQTLQSIPNNDSGAGSKLLLNTLQKIAATGTAKRLPDGKVKPLATFPSTPQKYGNCNYANKIASIEAMICLQKLHNQGNLNPESIQAYSERPENRRSYKAFTKASRESEVNRLISKIEQAKGNDQLLAAYLTVAIETVKQRAELWQKRPNAQKTKDEKERLARLMDTVAKYASKCPSGALA